MLFCNSHLQSVISMTVLAGKLEALFRMHTENFEHYHCESLCLRLELCSCRNKIKTIVTNWIDFYECKSIKEQRKAHRHNLMSPHSRCFETQHDFQLYTCATTRIQQYNVNEANHIGTEREITDQLKQFCTVISA